MRLKNFVLAAMAALAIAVPARAEILWSFRSLNTPPGNPTLPISASLTTSNTTALMSNSITMNPGEIRYVAVAIQVTPTAAGPVQNFWNSISGITGDLNQLAVHGANLTFTNPAVADNPYIPLPSMGATLNENNSNLRVQAAGAAYVNALPGDPFSPGWRHIVGQTTGGLQLDGSNNLPTTVLAAFKIVAGTPGTSEFLISRLTTGGPMGTPQNVWTVTDGAVGQSMDAEVFTAANLAGRTLSVTVVPEPSSMALAGLAVAGFGWRKLRRNKAKTETVA